MSSSAIVSQHIILGPKSSMVQHAPPSANNWPLHYWKLPHVERTHRIDLQSRLNALEYFWPPSASTSRLQQLSDRVSRGLLSYDACTTTALHGFCIQRKPIQPSDVPASPGFASIRPALITLLSLPPELREKVYIHHILSLLPPKHAPHEALLSKSMTMPPPPLAEVSHLLRQEALPIFYDLHRAKFGIIDPYGSVFGRGTYAFTDPMDRLIARGPDAVILRYRMLEISGIVSMNGRSSGRCGVWFSVDLPREERKGAVRRVGMFGGDAVMEKFEIVVQRMDSRLRSILGHMSERGRGLERTDLEGFRRCFEEAL